MRKYILTFILVLGAGVFSGLNGQTPSEGLWKWHAERGEALFRSGKYIEAHEELLKAQVLRGDMGHMEKRDLDYRLAMSAYRGGKAGTLEMLVHYLDTYPESVHVPYVEFAAGNVCFDAGDYPGALEYYRSVNTSRLNPEDMNEYNFKTGYCYFAQGKYGETAQYMTQIDFKSPYYTHAQYTLGYADYRRGDYASAKKYFMTIADSEAYTGILPFYLIHIEFSEGNYHYVTENGGRVLRMAAGERALELTRMIGEAWFHTSSWQNAVQYISEYEQRGGAMDRQTNYMMGFAQYMVEDWKRAESYLARVPGPDDRLSQNASYHLGDVYLKIGDKQRALQSFSIASAGRYDAGIAEDALFNYGKLQYELGGGYFNEAINILNRYLSQYPSSPRAPQVKEYLAAAYYNSHNFDAAYQAIVQMPDPDNNVKAALQKITYFRALECLQENDLEEASRMLDESLRNRYNAKYTALAGYWQGEVLYRQGHYREAAQKYDTYIRLSPKTEPENLMARYNSGYAYFNLREWETSREKFDDFLVEYKRNDSFRADAYNRRGDIEFGNRQFWRAIEFYDQPIRMNTSEKYYAAFQRAMMLGMVDRTDRKIESLSEIIKAGEGGYVADAAYELGRTYISQQRYREAASALERFITEHPAAPQYTAALLDLGLIYRNLNDNARSMSYYKMVVEKEKHSPEAREAMSGIRGIYVEQNEVDTYFAYAQSVGIETDLGTVQRDSLAFVSAQRVYLSGDRERAAQALDGYLSSYPNGSHVSNALYYSGENALARGEKRQAYGYFERLTQMYNNSFTSRGLERVAQLGMELRDYNRAADAYRQLGLSAVNSGKKDEALAGYLRATVLAGEPGEIERVTAEVLSGAAGNQLIREAKYARANALTALGRGEDALRLFAELSPDVSDAAGAESAYRVIEAAYGKGDSASAEKLIYEFAGKNTPHSYWLAKAFLTLGDIYAAAGDSFQARATYQSIVDGYSPATDGIVEEATSKIQKLK